MKRTLVTLGALCLIIAGCSNNGEPSAETTTRAAPTTTSATSSPSTPAPLDATLTYTGDPFTGDRGLDVDVTVFAVNQNIAPDAPFVPISGGHWVGADIQTCLKKADKAFIIGWSDWSALDGDSNANKASLQTYSGFPPNLYPFGPKATVDVGACVRGWVLFPVAFGTQITIVRYTPSFDGPGFWSAA
jgi:hypothetical protein